MQLPRDISTSGATAGVFAQPRPISDIGRPFLLLYVVVLCSEWLQRKRRASTKADQDLVAHRKCTMKTPVTRRQALAATSALALAFAANAGEREKVGMQLILAADVSGSVNSARYKTQQDDYLEALGDSRVLNVIAELEPPVLAIAFIAWAREQAVMVPWMRVQDAKSMELFRNRLKQTQRPQIGINTLISKALLFCDAL